LHAFLLGFVYISQHGAISRTYSEPWSFVTWLFTLWSASTNRREDQGRHCIGEHAVLLGPLRTLHDPWPAIQFLRDHECLFWGNSQLELSAMAGPPTHASTSEQSRSAWSGAVFRAFAEFLSRKALDELLEMPCCCMPGGVGRFFQVQTMPD